MIYHKICAKFMFTVLFAVADVAVVAPDLVLLLVGHP